MIWRTIDYSLPGAAFLFFAVCALVWMWVALDAYRHKKLADFSAPNVLKELLERRDPVYFWIKVILCCAVWIFAVAAFMQPKGNAHYVNGGRENVPKDLNTLRRNMQDIVFLLDVSASMTAADTFGGRTREAMAKEISDDIISHLQGENVALFGFTSATMQIVPPTTDYLFTRLMLRQLQINEEETSGTDIKQALEYVRTQMLQMPASNSKTLIILTDGEDTSLIDLSQEQHAQAIQQMLKLIRSNAEEHWELFIVGIGSKEGSEVPNLTYQGHAVISKLDESLLRQLSIVGKGELFLAEEATPWEIAEKIHQKIKKNSAIVKTVREMPSFTSSSEEKIFDEYFQIPLAAAILALALLLILPNSRKQKKLFK